MISSRSPREADAQDADQLAEEEATGDDGDVQDEQQAPPPVEPDPTPPDGDGDEFASCAVLDVQASSRNVPIDIVWIIDSSASMNNERAAIQRELNRFAERFGDASIDVRVVVMTEGDDFEVAAPLGVDSERFRLVDRNVGSNDALGFFIEHFDEYGDFLRPDAKLELIAVTDDESDLSADEFVSGMRAASGKEFRLHAIASEQVDGDACDGANDPGDQYYAAAAATSGLTFSVCQADGTALFETLAGALTEGTPLPCEIALPSAPQGAQLDLERINVVYDTAETGARTPIPRVEESGSCGDTGWFYDDPSAPRAISLCPSFCRGANTGNLHVVLGCQTVRLL